jgi:ABC-2 type transport system permease protein
MSEPSTLSTFLIFARTGVQRAINRSASIKFPALKKKSTDPQTTSVEARARTATKHRSANVSYFRRLCGMWLPIMSLVGIVGLSLNTMFIILGSINLEEMRSAPVLHVSREHYNELAKAAAISNTNDRDHEVESAISNAFSSSCTWQTNAGEALAKQRLDEKGIAAFAPLPSDGQWHGTLAYLSPNGRIRGMHGVGLYLVILNLALTFVVFGMTSKHISGDDPTLVWLWQFPLSRRVLFSSKLIEYMFDSPIIPMSALFYATAVWLCGASFFAGLSIGAMLGLSAGVAAAAVRLAGETFMTQRLSRRTRGVAVALITLIGSTSMLICMIGSNAQFLVGGIIDFANMLPNWFSWNVFTGGIGTKAMMDQGTVWWLVGPVTAIALAIAAVQLAVRLTARGLASGHDSVRSAQPLTWLAATPTGKSRLGTIVWKELLQMRRQPEFVGQVLMAPIGVGLLLYFSGYSTFMDLALKGGMNITIAILAGVSYLLMVAATQMLTSELKNLWLLQCQPRPLADIVRSKARVWAAIAIGVSLPVIGVAIALVPNAAFAILAHVPYLLAMIWLLAELLFGLTALSASVSNEQTVRFRRAMLLPLLVVTRASLAILSMSRWAELGTLATLAILNAAVRQRQLAELNWLSEPVETPPKKFYPMHAVLAIIGFQAIQNAVLGGLVQIPQLSSIAILSIAYCVAAIVVSAICGAWMSQNRLAMPASPRGPALRPIVLGLLASCTAGFLMTMFFRWWNVDHQVSAYAVNGQIRTAAYDKWCLLGLWVVAAPLFEEWIIRGMLYRTLRRSWGIGLSVALSAVLFATLHPAVGAIALLTLGTTTALAVEKTGRLWPSIIIHAVYNLMIWSLWVAQVQS